MLYAFLIFVFMVGLVIGGDRLPVVLYPLQKLAWSAQCKQRMFIIMGFWPPPLPSHLLGTLANTAPARRFIDL